MLINPLLRRKHIKKFPQIAAEEPVPAKIEVPVEAVGFVLGEQQQATQAAVETV